MKKWERMAKLLRNKDRHVHLVVNSELWELFKKLCEKENVSPNQKVSELILNYLEDSGFFKEEDF